MFTDSCILVVPKSSGAFSCDRSRVRLRQGALRLKSKLPQSSRMQTQRSERRPNSIKICKAMVLPLAFRTGVAHNLKRRKNCCSLFNSFISTCSSTSRCHHSSSRLTLSIRHRSSYRLWEPVPLKLAAWLHLVVTVRVHWQTMRCSPCSVRPRHRPSFSTKGRWARNAELVEFYEPMLGGSSESIMRLRSKFLL